MNKFQSLYWLSVCVLSGGVGVLLAGCGSGATPSGSSEGVELNTLEAELVSDSLYYSLRADTRKCVSPLCGGYFIRAVNQARTRCADGTRAAECYVAAVDFGALPVPDAPAVVALGTLGRKSYPGFGRLGVLTAEAVWGSLGSDTRRGDVYRLRDSGIRCITTPCFSIQAELLNQGTEVTLSDLDFERLELSDKQHEAAFAALGEGALLARGTLSRPQRLTGRGRQLTASALYLPSATSSCETDDDCAQDTWCRPTQAGGSECIAFTPIGESCGGHVPAWSQTQCIPGSQCSGRALAWDGTGLCRTECKDSTQCGDALYCATDGLCHDTGTCDEDADCSAEGNDWVHILCVGYATCSSDPSQGVCQWQCGTP
jgi:hypothetical protein